MVGLKMILKCPTQVTGWMMALLTKRGTIGQTDTKRERAGLFCKL